GSTQQQRIVFEVEFLLASRALMSSLTCARRVTKMWAPANGWIALGFRVVDVNAAMAHSATRMFIAWVDDLTGRTTVLDTLSSSKQSAPSVLPSDLSTSCVNQSS